MEGGKVEGACGEEGGGEGETIVGSPEASGRRNGDGRKGVPPPPEGGRVYGKRLKVKG